MVAERRDVYDCIDGERDYQDNLGYDRTGCPTGGGRSIPHTVGEFATMMQHYQNELVKAWTATAGDDAALHVMRKIAAIAVNCMEQHGALERGLVSSDIRISAGH